MRISDLSSDVCSSDLQFHLQVVEEQRADQLEDVLFAGVVRAQVAAGFGVHHRLEHRAEDGRADAAPVQGAGFQQQVAHLRVERGQRQGFLEQLAVDVGQLGQLLVQRALAAFRSEEHTSELQSLIRNSSAV